MTSEKFIHKVPSYRYRVDFSTLYDNAGKPSILSISQTTKVSRPTIAGMVQQGGVIVETLSNAVLMLAAYFDVDWKDYVTTEEIEEGAETPESETALIDLF